MSDLLQDVRIALRGLARNPVFATVAIVTLAVGIGGNTAIFSVLRAVVLRPLPFEEPERLVRIQSRNLESGDLQNLSPADFLDFESEARSLTRMGANGWIGPATIVGADGLAQRVGQVQVTEGFFPALGVQPAMGRLFSPEEDRPDAERVAVISDGLWRDVLGADPDVIGRTILLDARPTTVIGVLPSSFRHIEERTDRSARLFTPHRFDRADPNRGGHFIRAVGRLAPGQTLQSARSELAAIAARLEGQYPESNTDIGVDVIPLREAVVGDSRPALLMLLGATGLVLLVVCANMANLLLAAGAGRQKELAVRSALGAGRRRLVRQLVTESVVLGALGGAAGVLIAMGATGALTGISAAGIPRAADIGVDGVVLAFAALITLGTSVAFGLLPALVLAPRKLPRHLNQGGGRRGGATVARRPREVLVAAEIAVSVVLVVGAGLLVESLWRLQSEPVGFAATSALAMEIAPPLARYPEGTQIPFHAALEERVEALPGVVDAGAVNILPLTANYDGRGIQVEDAPRPQSQAPSAQARSVTLGYFEAMGVPLVRGRLFDERDAEDAPLVVLVSQAMADQFWPGEDPVGRRITFNSGIPQEEAQPVGGAGSREVVGVVGDVKHLELAAEAVPTFYTPHTQPPSYHVMTLVVRATGDAAALTPSIRAELADLDPNVPLSQVRTLDQVVTGSVAGTRLQATLLALFALTGLLLAAVGVYGVVAYLVGRRTHEIGIRLALGAPRSALVRMFVVEGMRPLAVGIAAGVAGALILSRVLQAMLFEVTHVDPSAYLFACAVLAAAGLVATVIPARRAVQAGSAAALRES